MMTPLHDFLIQLGADRVRHSGRTLYEHLCGVEAVLAAWGQSKELRAAGMFHSIYSTERFKHATLPMTERGQLKQLIGENSEQLVYLFSMLSRETIFQFSDSCSSLSSEVHTELPCYWNTEVVVGVSGAQIAELVLLHMANRLEQATKPATGIGFWLSVMSDRARRLLAVGVNLPKVLAELGTITMNDERKLHSLYLQGITFLQKDDAKRALTYLEPACKECGFVGEPYVMLAFTQSLLGDMSSARTAASKGAELLKRWGAPWHKRLPMEGWCQLSTLIIDEAPVDDIKEVVREVFAGSEQEKLFAEVQATTGSSATYSSITLPEAAVARFFAYLRGVQTYRSNRATKWYPGLSRKSWYNPAEFSVARELEAQFPAVRAEAVKVQSDFYHEEAEEIGRTGNWQVCMFYEQGRRNDFVCEQCPTITSILESDPSVRRSAGLIYLSKMAPHTHVVAHQASSNFRLRCHLALSIPDGDCAIRVGDEVHRWEEGKCIVFDDTFEHEVWNRTDEDRLVLLVDLWHPDLSSLEREALEAINWLSISRAYGIAGTWHRNNVQRSREGKFGGVRAKDLDD